MHVKGDTCVVIFHTNQRFGTSAVAWFWLRTYKVYSLYIRILNGFGYELTEYMIYM